MGDKEFVTVKSTGQDTGGAFSVLELVALPGAEPPPHIHRATDEVYCLLEGSLDLLDGGRTFTAQAGSIVHIPRGTLHAWRNATAEPARALLFVLPAGFEGVVEEVGVPEAVLAHPRPCRPPRARKTPGACWSWDASMTRSTPRLPPGSAAGEGMSGGLTGLRSGGEGDSL